MCGSFEASFEASFVMFIVVWEDDHQILWGISDG